MPALPLVFLVAWIAFTSLDRFIYLIVFLVPLSIPLTNIVGKIGVDLLLPTEPMLAGVMLLYFLKYLKGQRLDIRILRHPVSIAIYFNLIWIFLTSITSSMPLVSFKFLVARMWFLIAFYFIAAEIFKTKKSMRKYIWVYIIPFTFVIAWAIARHATHGLLNQMAAHAVVKPFYNDHTAYGMALGMLIPVLIGLYAILHRKITVLQRVLFILLILVYLSATLLSYTRATWVSLIGAAGLWILVLLKIRWQYVLATIVILVSLFFTFQTEILLKLESNKTTSSGKLTEHVKSISNVKTDASNLERINRWSCAIRMFEEKPVFGWGPGTYMFQYAPFQNSWEKTSISTDFHTLGNAHSEYLGPLAEQGLPGILSILSIIGLSLWTGLRVYFRTKSRQVRILALSIILSLVTYYIHGILNNFLDTDKASALFWGFTAILVALDVKYSKRRSERR
ncbi:MAG: O-antigen ligase family protein [Bacteroidales bacterium]|nr:O-antigen ligase family protein [Bacteroidales bacterium]